MKPTDKPAFAQLLADALAFYRQDVSTFALSVWWQACEAFDLEQVAKALTAHALDPDRGQFAPKPADLVRVLRGTSVDRSLIAWGKVLDAMQRVGAYRSVVFDDGAIHAAISDMGGWPALCRTTTDELPFTQKRFCDLHRAYAARPDAAYPPQLLGEHAMVNRLAGHAAEGPALVGDPERARQVEHGGVAGGRTVIQLSDALPAALRIGAEA